jgi:hypothetical protein
MKHPGLRKGDEVYVSIRVNKHLEADFLITVLSSNETSCEMYADPETDIIRLREALQVSLGTVNYRMEQPRLKRLLQERIAQLKAEAEEVEEKDPPTPTSNDIPF